MPKPTKTSSLSDAIRDVLESDESLDEVFVVYESGDTICLNEGKWIPTSTKNKIRIDHPTHGVGQTHAHIYGRKGDKIGVVNLDGTPSHGTSMILKRKDADTLRSRGFIIPPNRLVEWQSLQQSGFKLVLG